MRFLLAFLVLVTASSASATPPFTVTKYAGNPILSPTGGSNQDAIAVRDSCFVKAGSTYNLVYTGFINPPTDYAHWAETMLATMSSPTATPVRQGRIFPTVAGMAVMTAGADPHVLWDGSVWHAWVSLTRVENSGTRKIGHLVSSSGSATNFPSTGWTFENENAVVALTTGWTSDGAGGIAGVSAGKVTPAVGGGWIMFIAGWGNATSNYTYHVGYATSPSLYGPWTLSTNPLLGVTGGYQAEQATPFRYNGKFYLICNRLGLSGTSRIDYSWVNLGIDLWEADSQTGPYTLAQLDFIPRGASGSWDAKDMGVTGLATDNLDSGTIYGIYDANNMGGAAIPRSIGAFTITAPAISAATPAASSSTMSSSFR